MERRTGSGLEDGSGLTASTACLASKVLSHKNRKSSGLAVIMSITVIARLSQCSRHLLHLPEI